MNLETCFPSYRHIAEIVGLKDTKGVQKAIKEFEQLGLLSIENRKNDLGGHTSNRYHFSKAMGGKTDRGMKTVRLSVPEPSNTKDDTKDRDIDSDFEIFWKAYPRKVNKYQAKQKYYLITKTYDKDKLKCMLDKFVAHCEAEKTETKFIPHCSTFLNQRRFLDYEDIDIKDIKSICSPKEPDWKQQKRILSNEIEKRVVATWAESNEPENVVNVDPQASQKLKAIAEKFNLKGRSR